MSIFEPKTPHYSARRPSMVIIHGTEVDRAQTHAILTGESEYQASCHYAIYRDGETVQYLDESARAWHAGASYWAGFSDINSLSLGIELEFISPGAKFEEKDAAYTDAQMRSLCDLLKNILGNADYKIAPHHILGHQDIAPERKSDPGPHLDWKFLAEHGIGLWHGLAPAENDPVVTDDGFLRKLWLYGYDIRKDKALVIRAFQTHFMPWNICGQITEQSVKIIDILLEKKYEQV